MSLPKFSKKDIENLLKDNQIFTAVKNTFEEIFETASFKKQITLIDSILESNSLSFHSVLFHYTVISYKKIPTDRKDKFLYLIKKTFKMVDFEYILGIENEEVLGYIFSLVENKNEFSDWNDEKFVEFAMKAKPFIFSDIKIRIDRKSINFDKEMNIYNREILYRISEKQDSL